MTNLPNPDHLISVATAAKTPWDIVIIGAGMGGAAATYGLSEQGRRILLLEKGLSHFAEETSVTREEPDPAKRLKSGRWPTQLTGVLDGKRFDIWAPLGSGAGGSTLLYAAALHRLRPADFERRKLPDGGHVEWPFSYGDLAPYYDQAEALFSVRGSDDPLAPEPGFDLPEPEPMCARDQFFFRAFATAGLHPYKLHSAISYLPDCAQCLGNICLRQCKRDARNSLLAPALETGHVFLCGEVSVERLDAGADRVRSVTVRQGAETHKIETNTVVLAAGAYFSPVILLRSKSEHWPAGLANRHDQVGRNLMFHASASVAFWAPKNLSRSGATKTIAVRDFYDVDGEKYGEFQSTGLSAGYGNILYSLRMSFDQSRWRRLPLIRQLLRIPAWLAAKIFGEATIFATIVEDFAYADNRVLADDTAASGMRFEYRIRDELRARTIKLRALIRQRLRGLRSFALDRDVVLNYGHPCGTCRAGHDPRASVVDATCRAHGVKNLYVVDSSIMATSGGTNPSLTVAANALRVAAAIDKDLRAGKQQ